MEVLSRGRGRPDHAFPAKPVIPKFPYAKFCVVKILTYWKRASSRGHPFPPLPSKFPWQNFVPESCHPRKTILSKGGGFNTLPLLSSSPGEKGGVDREGASTVLFDVRRVPFCRFC